MSPSAEKKLDRALWYGLSASLVILVLLSFIHISSLDAFVELKSSALRLEFENRARESVAADFGAGATIVAAPARLAGSRLHKISALSGTAGLLLEAQSAKGDRASICLLEGRYVLSVRDRSEKHADRGIEVARGDQWCMDALIGETFIVRPRRIVVEPRLDSKGMEVYPEVSGKLRVRDTDRELALVSGMTLRLLLEAKPDTKVGFADGRFAVNAWKPVRIEWSERGGLATYTYTPLDVLRKFAGDNGLWYSISLLVGIGFGARKVLSLR